MLPLAKVSAMVGFNLNLAYGKQCATVPYQKSEAKKEHVPEKSHLNAENQLNVRPFVR